MSTSAAVPLRIEFPLDTPWCPPAQGLHLDGLIAWGMVQAAQAGGAMVDPDIILANLPFERDDAPEGWVWKASLLQAGTVRASERRYMTTKTSVEDMTERLVDGRIAAPRAVSKIDTGRGLFKNDAQWYTVEHVDRLTAWCVGDPDRIAEALNFITHLGKRTRLDHGRLGAGVVMDEDPLALTHWQRRHLPYPMDGFVAAQGRLHPPYWQGEGVSYVWRPAQR